MKKKGVCAVIVTYNRKDYLKKLLGAIEKQTYFIEGILIFDNNSSDETKTMLVEKGIIDTVKKNKLVKTNIDKHQYYCYLNAENAGGSGGFYEAIRIAANLGFDFLWCMDDDVYPEQDCLEKLLCNMSNNSRICIPSRTDTEYIDYAVTDVNMTNPFKYSIVTRKKMIKNENIEGNTVKVVDMPFEGPLIDSALVQEIGLPKKEFFIIFDDSEYAARACKKTDILYCKDAILHKQIIPKIDKNEIMNWKNYYGYRNQIWFDRNYGKNVLVRIIRPRLLYLDIVVRAVIKRKYSNIQVIRRAYKDGIHDNLGKLVEPGTLGKDISL